MFRGPPTMTGPPKGMLRLSETLLADPAQRTVRRIAMERVAVVAAALDRLLEGDPNALHDLRVALRRLRAWFRAYRPYVDDTLRGRTRRALGAIAKATNAAREAQVALEWVDGQADSLEPRQRPGWKFLHDRLADEARASARTATKELGSRLPKALNQLRSQLEHYWRYESIDEHAATVTMAHAMAEIVSEHAKELARSVRGSDPADAEAAHRTRIAAKRLRYVVEPLDDDPKVKELIGHLTSLQDALGEARDARQLADRVVQVLGGLAEADAKRRAADSIEADQDSPASPPPTRRLRAGLIEVGRRARAAEHAALDRLEAEWTKGNADHWLSTARAIARAMQGSLAGTSRDSRRTDGEA